MEIRKRSRVNRNSEPLEYSGRKAFGIFLVIRQPGKSQRFKTFTCAAGMKPLQHKKRMKSVIGRKKEANTIQSSNSIVCRSRNLDWDKSSSSMGVKA